MSILLATSGTVALVILAARGVWLWAPVAVLVAAAGFVVLAALASDTARTGRTYWASLPSTQQAAQRRLAAGRPPWAIRLTVLAWYASAGVIISSAGAAIAHVPGESGFETAGLVFAGVVLLAIAVACAVTGWRLLARGEAAHNVAFTFGLLSGGIALSITLQSGRAALAVAGWALAALFVIASALPRASTAKCWRDAMSGRPSPHEPSRRERLGT